MGGSEGLGMVGRADARHFCSRWTALGMFAVETGMAKGGWSATGAEQADSSRVFVNMAHQEVVEEYLRDLRAVVTDVRAGRLRAGEDSIVYVT